MADQANKKSALPGWYADGLEHIWLPYAQMKTVLPPLPVVRTQGVRIVLADGRELIDGIASWWTACHGYNHPHIRQALEAQLAQMPHVMFGGLAHEQALRLAKRLTELMPGDLTRVFFSRLRFSRSRSRNKDGSAVLDQPWCARQESVGGFQRWLSRRHHRGHGGERS